MKKINDVNQAWKLLIKLELFTERELQLVTHLNGFRLEVLNDCLFARYGYRDLEEMLRVIEVLEE